MTVTGPGRTDPRKWLAWAGVAGTLLLALTLAAYALAMTVGRGTFVGTLIPMGSSLASLATGNLEAMAGQMVVAFTTTIIGLATGTLAYVVAAARQSWVNETIREQRFIAEHIAQELKTLEIG